MPEPRFSIVVVGDGAVGKSALTLRFLRDQFHDEYDPTIEDSYCRHIEVDEKEYTLDIIDTAGQDEYRGHWNDQFLRAGDGFICVYSITSMGSFQELIGLRDQIWRAKESEHVPMMIAANKSDLEEERQIAMKTGQEFATMSNSLYIETSAKTGINIHEMVCELVREIVRTRQQEPHHEEGPLAMTTSPDKKGYVKNPTATAPTHKSIRMDMMDGERARSKQRESKSESKQQRQCCCMTM